MNNFPKNDISLPRGEDRGADGTRTWVGEERRKAERRKSSK